MAQRYYTLDEFLLRLLPSQRYTRIICLDFFRENRAMDFRYKSLVTLYVAVAVTLIDFVCNVIKISLYIREQRLQEAKQIAAVWSIESLCLVRGISLVLKQRNMLELTNDLDKIFPRDSEQQLRMNCAKFARYLDVRFRIVGLYTLVGVTVFIGTPLLKYLLYYDASSGQVIPDEYHQHASWYPYHLKDNPRTYPYVYVYEGFNTICSINLVFAWDHIYTVSVAEFLMHFDFVNSELANLDARESLHQGKRRRKFFSRLLGIIQYHQHVLKLGDKFCNAFNLSLFFTNLVSAASICFHVYLIANSDDYLSIILFSFPCLVQVAFAFDNCYQGTRIAVATSETANVIFGHNWYEGSVEYRKITYQMLQFASRPFTLSGYNLFRIDMVHFRMSMMIAYRMFTFLQARGERN